MKKLIPKCQTAWTPIKLNNTTSNLPVDIKKWILEAEKNPEFKKTKDLKSLVKKTSKKTSGWVTLLGLDLVNAQNTGEHRVSNTAVGHSSSANRRDSSNTNSENRTGQTRNTLLVGITDLASHISYSDFPEDFSLDEVEAYNTLRKNPNDPLLAYGLAHGQTVNEAAANYIRTLRDIIQKQNAVDYAFNSYAQEHANDEILDGPTLDEKAKEYWDPIKGAPQRWSASWHNDTNPVKAIANTGIAYTIPGLNVVLGIYDLYNAADHLTSKDGLQKTYNLYNNGDIYGGTKSLMGDVLDATVVAGLGYTGFRLFNNYGKYHGFGNQKVNNLFDRVTAREFTAPGELLEGRIRSTELTTPGGKDADLIASAGESDVFVDPSNSNYVLKVTTPLVGRGTSSTKSTVQKGLDYVTDFNSPGGPVEPIRFAGYTSDGRIVTRLGAVTPFKYTGLTSLQMRNAFYEATEGMPEQNRYFTDEALAKYGDANSLHFYDNTNPVWSDVREANVGLNSKGQPVLFDYISNKNSTYAAGNRGTYRNARTMLEALTNGNSYYLDELGVAGKAYDIMVDVEEPTGSILENTLISPNESTYSFNESTLRK